MTPLFNRSLVAALVISSFVAPVAVFAQTTTGTRTPKNNFCTRIEDGTLKLYSGFDARMDGNTSKRDANEQARMAKLTTQRQTWDANLAGDRAASQARLNIRFNALNAKADTDAKKAAVAAFQTAVNAAVAKRIAAVDAAIKAHRDGVDTIVQTKFTSLDTDAATFKSAVDAALLQAKTDCGNNVAPATARATLIASVKAAQTTFKANRTDAEIKTQLETLAATRKQAVAAAMTQFKADMTAATTALKAAFAAK
jgi:hypothetical protein